VSPPASVLLLASLACSIAGAASDGDDDGDRAAAGAAAQPFFVEEAESRGLRFTHRNGMSGALYMPETVGAGAALLDHDGDGDLDVFLAQGGSFAPGEVGGDGDGGRLFRNLLIEDGTLRFAPADDNGGLRASGYGMGVATGDYDNDGDADLYLANFGPDQLWRNDGGRFADVTGRSGASDPSWSVAASFVDLDRDGWLDLYVANYLDFRFEIHKVCRMASGAADYCGPSSYAPVADRLYRNRGDGTFEDVSARAGIRSQKGAGLGVVALDADADGWLDLYVANDQEANFLWRNRGDGSFEDVALLAGCAVDGEGRPEASMGVDAADFDSDGDLDLILSHLTGETHTLYRSEGAGIFRDVTVEVGLAEPTLDATGFGAGFLDVDHDGWLDLLVANGAVRKLEALVRAGDPYPLRQRSQLFRNLGGGRFADASGLAGAAFERAEVGRGAAFGDLDDDGDTDVVINNNAGPARLLLGTASERGHWIGLVVLEGSPSRTAVGALVSIERAGDPPRVARVATDGSYASARDPRVVFGLGDDARSPRIRVRWPDGAVEEWREPAIDRYLPLRRGGGTARSAAVDPRTGS
jgi:hypothetical protein